MTGKGLLMEKSWQAQEYFNKYLALKEELLDLAQRVEQIQLYPVDVDAIALLKGQLEAQKEEKVKELNFVLEQLEIHGISMKDLIKLSCGIQLYL